MHKIHYEQQCTSQARKLSIQRCREVPIPSAYRNCLCIKLSLEKAIFFMGFAILLALFWIMETRQVETKYYINVQLSLISTGQVGATKADTFSGGTTTR